MATEERQKSIRNPPQNEEADCKLEEWKDFLKPYSPLDPEPGLGGILSLGLFSSKSSSFLTKSPYRDNSHKTLVTRLQRR